MGSAPLPYATRRAGHGVRPWFVGSSPGASTSSATRSPLASQTSSWALRKKATRNPDGFWSGKRDLNSRPRPWQGRALPTELFPQTCYPQHCFGITKVGKNFFSANFFKLFSQKKCCHSKITQIHGRHSSAISLPERVNRNPAATLWGENVALHCARPVHTLTPQSKS